MIRSVNRQSLASPSKPKTRLAVSLSGLLVAGAALAGCSQMSPQTTQLQYAASDGIVQDAGDVGVRNLLLVANDPAPEDARVPMDATAGMANLVGTFVNTSDAPLTLTVSTADGESTPIEVPAGGATAVGETTQLLLPLGPDLKPGMMVPVTVTGGSQEMTASVPLLDGTLPEYSTLTPTAPAPAGPEAGASASPGVADRTRMAPPLDGLTPSASATTAATSSPTSTATP